MKYLIISLLLLSYSLTYAQPTRYTLAQAHSHNDYEHSRPFFEAYELGFGSIEADVYLKDRELYVAHDFKNITPERTFRKLYLEPLVAQIEQHKGKPYPKGQPLQLLIDLKTGGKEILDKLFEQLKPYRGYFDARKNKHAVRIIISGAMPKPEDFEQYDAIFSFDGRKELTYTSKAAERVSLVSISFPSFGPWNGKNELPPAIFNKAKSFVDSVHQQKKAVRFWATPNTITAYETLVKLKADYIGTDSLRLLSEFIKAPKTR